MSKSDDYIPKFSFEITREQRERIDECLPVHGSRKAIFHVILDDLLDMIEEHGQIVLGILLDRRAKPREIMPSLAEAERKAK